MADNKKPKTLQITIVGQQATIVGRTYPIKEYLHGISATFLGNPSKAWMTTTDKTPGLIDHAREHGYFIEVSRDGQAESYEPTDDKSLSEEVKAMSQSPASAPPVQPALAPAAKTPATDAPVDYYKSGTLAVLPNPPASIHTAISKAGGTPTGDGTSFTLALDKLPALDMMLGLFDATLREVEEPKPPTPPAPVVSASQPAQASLPGAMDGSETVIIILLSRDVRLASIVDTLTATLSAVKAA